MNKTIAVITSLMLLSPTNTAAGACDVLEDWKGEHWGGNLPANAPVILAMRRQITRMQSEGWGNPRYIADLEAQIEKFLRTSGRTDCPALDPRITFREFTKAEIEARPNLMVGLHVGQSFLFVPLPCQSADPPEKPGCADDFEEAPETLRPAEHDYDFPQPAYDYDPADWSN